MNLDDTVYRGIPARHLLDVDDLSVDELLAIVSLAEQDPATVPRVLEGLGVALVFEKSSNRTRNSSEMATVALGGHPVYIQGVEVGIDIRESAADVARTLACYHAIIGARVMDHGTLHRMVEALDAGTVPVSVVNLLSDQAHPCQALADLLTLRQVFGPDGVHSKTLAYIGDANNVWRSLAIACAMAGVATRIAAPAGYGPTAGDVDRIEALGGNLTVTEDPAQAAHGADALYGDVWTSMGQEEETAARLEAFKGFIIDTALLARAAPDAVVLHCLPAHRGEEISASVVDGPHSVVWMQAANRMHAMRGLLAWIRGALPAGGSEP